MCLRRGREYEAGAHTQNSLVSLNTVVSRTGCPRPTQLRNAGACSCEGRKGGARIHDGLIR